MEKWKDGCVAGGMGWVRRDVVGQKRWECHERIGVEVAAEMKAGQI